MEVQIRKIVIRLQAGRLPVQKRWIPLALYFIVFPS
jgi:hypothetical protein